MKVPTTANRHTLTSPYENDSEAAGWHYWPAKPNALDPNFDWLPKLMAILQRYSAYWFAASTTTPALILAILTYFDILLPLNSMQNMEAKWISQVWPAKLIPHTRCAGLMNFWLYRFEGQDKAFKFDPRKPANDGTFTFRNQVQEILSWEMANGYATVLFLKKHPLVFAMFPFLIL